MKAFEAVRNSLPGAKPELWSTLPNSLIRNCRARWFDPPSPRTVALRNGGRIFIDPSTDIGLTIYLYRCWEYPVTRLLLSLINPSDVFLDIGANIGYFTVVAASVCEEVHAFEPVPELYGRLERNINLNSGCRASAHSCAMSKTVGSSRFYVVAGRNTGLSSLHEQKGAKEIDVKTTTLDAFVEKQHLSRVDLMKVDVEGAEEDVFLGGQSLLSSSSAPDIIFECHSGATGDALLKSFGYRIFELVSQRKYEARNLFATKRNLSRNVEMMLRKL